MYYYSVKEYNKNLNTIHADLTLEKRLEIYKIILKVLNDETKLSYFICNIINDTSEIRNIFDTDLLGIQLVGFPVRNKKFRRSYFLQDVFPEIIRPHFAIFRHDAWFSSWENQNRITIINTAIEIAEKKLKENETA